MKDIVCPHCGFVFKDSLYSTRDLFRDGDDELMTCEECNKEFVVMIDIVRTFTTRKTSLQEGESNG